MKPWTQWAVVMVSVLGCSKSDVKPAQIASGAPVLPASTAAASASAAPAESPGLVVDAGWIASAPRLTSLLTIAPAVCVQKETFMPIKSSVPSYARSYDIYAPSVAQADLEQRFRVAVKALGYAVTTLPVVGLGFEDRSKHVTATLLEARVSVLTVQPGSPKADVARIAANDGFETWGLIEASGDDTTWVTLTIDREASGGVTLQAELVVAEDKRGATDAWSRKQKLVRDGEAWVRKFQPNAPQPSAIFIEMKADGRLSIMEHRGAQLSGPACSEHASRAAKQPAERDAGRPGKATDDDLLKQMLGH